MSSEGDPTDLREYIHIDHGNGAIEDIRPDPTEYHVVNLDKFLITGPRCSNVACDRAASASCGACHLVKYCGKQCQKSHWQIHKQACRNHGFGSNWEPRWIREARKPVYLEADGGRTKEHSSPWPCPWGTTPAYDVVNLPNNEGDSYNQQLNILFAHSGDLRSVVQTLVSLPETFQERRVVCINDSNSDIVVRNVLLMLVIYHFPPREAAVIVTHIWYSAKLPQRVVDAVQKNIKPLIQNVCTKIPPELGDDCIVTREWDFWSQILGVALKKKHWFTLLNIVGFGVHSDSADKAREDAYNTRADTDWRDVYRLGCTTHRRVSEDQFLKDGVLVPFGTDTSAFTVPNPTLFGDAGTSYKAGGFTPLQGWNVQHVIESGRNAGFARNDLYGALAHFVQNKTIEFHKALREHPSFVWLTNVEALAVPRALPIPDGFDRIEFSYLIEPQWISILPLFRSFEPLLKGKAQNPHACLIGCHTNVVANMWYLGQSAMPRPDNVIEMIQRTLLTLKLTDSEALEIPRLPREHPRVCLRDAVMGYFIRFEDFIDPIITECAARTRELYNIKAKGKNTVVEEWPIRVRGTVGGISMEQVELMCLRRSNGQQRVIEWKRL